MTDVELVDALALFLQHQPDCLKEPCTCGMTSLYAAVIHRLLPSQNPAPDVAELRAQVADLWEQHVPLAPVLQ